MEKKLSRKAKKEARKATAKPAKKIKRVEDMTIGEVLQLPAYQENLKKVMHDLKSTRDKKRLALKGDEKLCAHPIDKLVDKGLWNAGDMTVLYAQIRDKVAKNLSSNERKFIDEVGTEAFGITMLELIEDEKKRDNDNGTSQQ